MTPAEQAASDPKLLVHALRTLALELDAARVRAEQAEAKARTLQLEFDAARQRADCADQHVRILVAAAWYDEPVPVEVAVRYIRDGLEHRARCSTWLAQIDHALGSECDLTQAEGEDGERSQSWRIARIADAEVLLDYLSGSWRDCTHEGIGLPGCPTCEGRWSAEVRAAVQAHRDREARAPVADRTSELRRHHAGTEAERLDPSWHRTGVPLCDIGCPLHDGKRCIALGFRPGPVCQPAVEALAAMAFPSGVHP